MAAALDIIKLIAGIGGMGLGAVQQNQTLSQNKDLAQQQINNQMSQFRDTLKQSQGSAGLAATQMNPFAQQQSRQKQALASSLLSNYQPASLQGNKFTGGLNIPKSGFSSALPFFGSDAMQNAESTFTKNVQGASPGYTGPNYQGAGYQSPTPGNTSYFNGPAQPNGSYDGHDDKPVSGFDGSIDKSDTPTFYDGDPGVSADSIESMSDNITNYQNGQPPEDWFDSVHPQVPQDPNKPKGKGGIPDWLKIALGIGGALM